ncbi:hypothetical protein [Acidipila sp. EB88]|uniref:hypothetical protein n=1 Tax=Acidipila sp. EB88 TaxID=2305226 RepID=UPI000F5E64C1|nr:hypothetical protein [Acidipila sp. EB88]RRA48897.1 hypothetical protein D1Y84_12000 [Acidipila sp. EB88]
MWRRAQGWAIFALSVLVQLYFAHALAFFAHEFAHSFLAWALGWKQNPWALTYGHLDAANLLIMSEIDENVDYGPIFGTHHGWQAGLIAAAGAFIGNALVTYPLARWWHHAAARQGRRTAALFAYWLVVASVGNLLDYVPVRTFSYREDMHTVAQGFACSPWWVLLVLGLPTALVLLHFFFLFEPAAQRRLFRGSKARRCIMAFFTAFVVFCFYGAAGWAHGGAASHWLSVFAVCVLFPMVAAIECWFAAHSFRWMRETP